MDRPRLAELLRASLDGRPPFFGQSGRSPAGALAEGLGGWADWAEGAGASAAGPAVVCEADPGRFQAAFAAAVAGRGDVFLADPAWGEEERRRMEALVRGSHAGGATGSEGGSAAAGGDPDRGWLMIPSGGTGGGLKFARHDGWTLAAAVAGFQAHFGFTRVDALGLLPLHHVSGLMAWVRCALTGGSYRHAPWKAVEAGRYPEPPGAAPCLSLVPTQLQRLLGAAGADRWLRGHACVFVGGGPVWPQLAEAAAARGLRVSLGYGMTETAAMATALLPEEFLAGDRSCGRPLPHIRAAVTASGTVLLAGDSLFRGYYPAWRPSPEPFETEDQGEFDGAGRLRILGRRDALIITGGSKVDPAEVEAVLRATGQFEDIAVVGVADGDWGQRVVACHPQPGATGDGRGSVADPSAVRRALESIAPHKRPKDFVAVSPWPRNAQGKINRTELARRAAAAVGSRPG